eukprot:scaffold69_cov248-Pinguiococcus_pyrenoidosus.AAC.24
MKTLTSMVRPDGWCKHFDFSTRSCSIYDDRPQFCRVDKDRYVQSFQIEPDDFADFAADCCAQSIDDVYGESSDVMVRFEAAQEALEVVLVPTPGRLIPEGDSA